MTSRLECCFPMVKLMGVLNKTCWVMSLSGCLPPWLQIIYLVGKKREKREEGKHWLLGNLGEEIHGNF